MSKKLPPYLAQAMSTLAASDRPMEWGGFAVLSTKGGRFVNVYRHLIRRRWIVNVTKPYRAGETYTGPRPNRYVLTGAGREALAAHRAATAGRRTMTEKRGKA